MLLRATTRRLAIEKSPGARGQSRPIRRSSNKHLHLAIAIAVSVASLVAVAIPLTRTQANSRSDSEIIASQSSDRAADALQAQTAGVTSALAATQGGDAALSPLGAGLFPEPLLEEAARIVVRQAFPLPEGQAALSITRSSAVPFTLHEDGFSANYTTKQITVGQALAAQGIEASEGDLVTPALDSELAPGAHVYIRHALDVRLVVAGTEQKVKTHGHTVGDVLGEMGVGLQGLDRVSPGATKPVRSGMTIRVTMIRDIIENMATPIEYSSFVQYDAELAMGQRIIVEGGENGAVYQEYRVRYVNGRETRRELVAETVTPAKDEIVSVGTYERPAPVAVAAAVAPPVPAPQPAQTGGCSRTLNVYATWYSAASAGGSGVTATGTGVYKGIVAVDPRVIPLGTRMYVPGYGYAIAADTGGGVVGNHIDLGYGADDVKDWRTRWVDICIL